MIMTRHGREYRFVLFAITVTHGARWSHGDFCRAELLAGKPLMYSCSLLPLSPRTTLLIPWGALGPQQQPLIYIYDPSDLNKGGQRTRRRCIQGLPNCSANFSLFFLEMLQIKTTMSVPFIALILLTISYLVISDKCPWLYSRSVWQIKWNSSPLDPWYTLYVILRLVCFGEEP